MKTQKLFCKIGKHDWERPAQRGKPPICCPEHRPETVVVKGGNQELYCETGKHTWTRESKRGRKPRNCPEHQPVVAANSDGLIRARQARSENSQKSRKARLRDMLSEATNCKCGFTEDSTNEEIRAIFPNTCTSPAFVCPTADKLNRLLVIPERISQEKREESLEESE